MRAIATRLLIALALIALPGAGRAQQASMQFPTTGWQAYAPAVVECGNVMAANLGTTGADVAITISVPTVLNGGGPGYFLDKIVLSNASVSLTTAAVGFFTAAGATGTTLSSNAALSTLTAAAANTAGSAFAPTLATGATTGLLNVGTIYMNMGTGQTATVDVRLYCRPAYR